MIIRVSETETPLAHDGVLHALLACPVCRTPVARRGDEAYHCAKCEARYLIVDGVPVFADASAIGHDELDHIGGHDHGLTGDVADSHKAAQSAWFDREALAEFEIDRPSGAPELYGFLLREKFRRSIAPLGARLDGWTALTVCGGSGMDAEFLAGVGASVISSDLSLGAALRVTERAVRHGVPITPIVADVERLPFADQSIDLVYVHDGLHHLEDPFRGLAEMARVARRAVCVTEPASAALTAMAVRVGLALAREEAGNQVARLRPGEVASALQSAGFRITRAERYAMYYRHVPGRVMSVLSGRPFLPLSRLGWRLGNAVLGRFGNKMTVVGVRLPKN
jgi:ubiquinone/menaquinone biosynthesis C-methylase UbiE/uncharacterized protein YbaR (Trm112 family)